jgi:8-oxo-dGTP pyrophosphatase MutT (NUDIX family)
VGTARLARGVRLHHRDDTVLDLRTVIEANLRSFERIPSTQALRPAAVAVVLLEDGGAASVPIFQRTSDMSRHAGQMALPGGRLHDGESAEDCAIRELREELGLMVGRDDVIGSLDDFDTRSGFTITPVVMWSGATADSLEPSKFEVAELYVVSVPDLRQAAAAATHGPSSTFSMKLERVEVFAPTAAILYQFSEVALDGRTVRVADFFQPPWTHR